MHLTTMARKPAVQFSIIALAAGIVLFVFLLPHFDTQKSVHIDGPPEVHASKAARWQYTFNLLRSPKTNSIPSAIRSRELNHAQDILFQSQFLNKQSRMQFQWFEVGPTDVGGRTRALAIDIDNGNRLIAGGVSGGLWETMDAGLTWNPLFLNGGNLSVTSIAQDPRPGQRDIWYYASGEFTGNSASDPGRVASYYGSGIYKSTNDGRNWTLLNAAGAGDPDDFDSPFDYVSRLVVSPTTGTLFAASNGIGIYRSHDQGISFGPNLPNRSFPGPVLGGVNDHFWSEVAVNANGVLLATLSSIGSNDNPSTSPGVYVSTDDGVTWRDITPPTFPNVHGRSVIAFAPSSPNLAYVYTTTLNDVNNKEDVRLHRIDVSSSTSINLSGNIPRFSEAGNLSTQGGYNMAIAVKPDDPDFVIYGGTNVYRTRNGFTTLANERLDYWIGGYDAVDDDFGNYSNHHPDQHVFIFDPSNPNRLWNANDGGIYMTNDIPRFNEVSWNDRNQGYNVTQFYTVALADKALDPRIAGGTQDNGTPFMQLDDPDGSSRNISVGDGAHLYFGERFAYVGFQNGATLRLQYNANDAPTFSGFSYIQPESADNQLFINPFVVDPNDENIMYYPAGRTLWRNDRLGTLRGGQTNDSGSDDGWTELNQLPSLGLRVITAIAVSKEPAHVLYFGASDTRFENAQEPFLYRLDNANTGDGRNTTNISVPGLPGEAYIVDIAVNPQNADELIVVMSNYEIIGLYHSTNGGQSFTPIEGNLQGSDASPGPSLRAAAILPLDGTTHYLVGTSTGLYTTTDLNGNSTTWIPESESEISQAVVTDIAARDADGVIAAATHGRGLFVGSQDPDFQPRPIPDTFTLSQNSPNPFASITRITYDLRSPGRVTLSLYDLSGRLVTEIVSNQEKETGRHEAVFNAASIVSGTYLYQLRVTPTGSGASSGTFSRTRKMMIIK